MRGTGLVRQEGKVAVYGLRTGSHLNLPVAGLRNFSLQFVQWPIELVLFQGKWYLLGTIWSDFGDCISDPYLIHMSEDRLTAEPISGESF